MLWDPRALSRLLSHEERPRHSQPCYGALLGLRVVCGFTTEKPQCLQWLEAGNVGILLLESSYCKGCPLDFNGEDCKCSGTNKIVCIALFTHSCTGAPSAVTQGRVWQGVQVGTELQAKKGLLCEWKSLERGKNNLVTSFSTHSLLWFFLWEGGTWLTGNCQKITGISCYLFVSTPGCVGYFAVVIMSAHLLVAVPNQFTRHA